MAAQDIHTYPIIKFTVFSPGGNNTLFYLESPNLGVDSAINFEPVTGVSSFGTIYTKYFKISGNIIFNSDNAAVKNGIDELKNYAIFRIKLQVGGGINIENQGNYTFEFLDLDKYQIGISSKTEIANGWAKGNLSLSGFSFELPAIERI
jgi:hypothetical protein